jgi:hypothetical protein
MFSKKDYQSYFQDLESILSKQIVLLTDILNEVSDKSVHSKLYAISLDDSGIFDDIRAQKARFED